MKWIVVFLCLFFPTAAFGLTVADKTYEETINVKGVRLKLIGAGLREVFGFDVYAIGAYSQSGECEDKDVVDSEQVKYLRLDILRNIDAAKVVNRIEEAFGENMPSNPPLQLISKRDKSFSYFHGQCVKGTVYEFIYIPGKGTIFKQDGRVMGPTISGKDYHTVFWNVYFGPTPCSDSLKRQLLEKCMPEPTPDPWGSDDPYSVYRN